MNYIIILSAIIFILYIFYSPCNSKKIVTNETFIPNNSDNLFKKNSDVDYIKDRTKIKVKSNKQAIAPINKGISDEVEEIKVPDFLESTRVPDSMSDMENYVIPLPEFRNIAQENILKENKNKKNEEQENVVEKQNKKIDKIKKNIKCKFITKIGNSKFKCPRKYPNFSGASIIMNGKNISCDGKKLNIKPAKAIAKIKKGKLSSIVITDSGNNYRSNPKIKIIGDGNNGEAYGIIKDKKLYKIIIKNAGYGYESTPKVKISPPNLLVKCNMCCKNE